jgi:hypothetical protein
MADRKLVDIFTDAHWAERKEDEGCTASLELLKKKYGEVALPFFNMPAYSNPIGIEIEAEGFKGCDFGPYLWRITEDNSLKKNGVEFISQVLVKRKIDYALKEAQLLVHKLEFGHRTSIHVHCNVSHYTESQLMTLAAYYALMEELFFKLPDPLRRGNSFCYPLVGTEPELRWWKKDDEDAEENHKTTKYCAFNIAPIAKQMSVEFRHLHGTKDFTVIRRWIQLCAKLVYYCGNLNKDEHDARDVISKGQFETLVLPKILGDTISIFDRRDIQSSVRNGELWALILLEGL